MRGRQVYRQTNVWTGKQTGSRVRDGQVERHAALRVYRKTLVERDRQELHDSFMFRHWHADDIMLHMIYDVVPGDKQTKSKHESSLYTHIITHTFNHRHTHTHAPISL